MSTAVKNKTAAKPRITKSEVAQAFSFTTVKELPAKAGHAGRGRGASKRDVAFLAHITANPGQWSALLEDSTPAKAGALSGMIRHGKRAAFRELLAAKRLEVENRNGCVFVRVVK